MPVNGATTTEPEHLCTLAHPIGDQGKITGSQGKHAAKAAAKCTTSGPADGAVGRGPPDDRGVPGSSLADGSFWRNLTISSCGVHGESNPGRSHENGLCDH